MFKLCSIVFLLLASAGCATSGESFFQVQGSLFGRDSKPEKCLLQLLKKGAEKAIDHREVGSAFQTEFVIPAGRAQYFFTAECPDGTHYQSKDFELGSSKDFAKKIALGVLRPMPAN